VFGDVRVSAFIANELHPFFFPSPFQGLASLHLTFSELCFKGMLLARKK
jgi:hypothetical protein